MRINKLSKSDSFDLYTQTLSDFLLKKEAKKSSNIIEKIAGVGGLIDLINQGARGGTHLGRGRAGQALYDSIRSGDLAASINRVRKADGTIDLADPNYAKVAGEISDAFSEASKIAARAAIDANGYSTKNIELFFGSEDNLAKLFELSMIRKYSASHPTGVISQFEEVGGKLDDIIALLNNGMPIADDDKLNIFLRATKRTHGGGFNFLKHEPEDLFEMERLLDADPTDVARIAEESTPAARLDTPEDVPPVKPVDTPEDVPPVKPVDTPEDVPPVKPVEELSEASDDLADAGKLTDDDALQSLRQDFSETARDLQKQVKDLDEKLESRMITQAQHDELMKVLKEKGIKLEKTSNRFVDKLKAAGASAWAITTWTNIGKVGALVALGLGAVAGYDYLFGGPSSAPTVDPTETPSARQGDRVTIDPQRVEAERAFREGDSQAVQNILSNPSVDQRTLGFIANKYRKDKAYKLPRPFDGMEYVFMTDRAGGLDIDDPATLSANLDLLIDALNNRKKGLPIYQSFLGSMESSQHALNEAAEEILEKGLYRKRRSRRYQMGRGTSGRRGVSGFADKPVPREVRRRMRRQRRRANDINQDRLQKLSQLKDISLNSTNNNLNKYTNLLKKADEVSKSYVKDAVKGLNHEDKTLREYFTGLGRLYDAESEKRNPDYEELYKLHNETGRDLTLSAHPKAIRVSDGLGNGGLVENGLEQKEKLEEVALSTPTGNFKSRYAKLKNLFNKSSKT